MKKTPPTTGTSAFIPTKIEPADVEGKRMQATSTSTTGSRPSTMTSSSDVAMETTTEKPEVVGSKESRTVFVSNLAMAVTEERLREMFSKVRKATY